MLSVKIIVASGMFVIDRYLFNVSHASMFSVEIIIASGMFVIDWYLFNVSHASQFCEENGSSPDLSY